MALHPVGPLPASVYWRRRLVLLAVLVAAVLLLRSCASGADPEDRLRTGATPTPSASSPRPTPSATRSPARTGPVTCTDAMLRVSVTSDARSYREGTSPRFTVRVTNSTETPCRRDLGGKQVELRVYSGDDRIWSSDDCGDTTGRSLQTIGAGSYLETQVTWSGTRSRPGCTGDKSKAQPGTYYAKLRVGTLRASGAVFRITSAA